MAARQVSAYDLRTDITLRQIHRHAPPTVLPLGVGEKAVQDFGIQVALALKIAVEPAVGEASVSHDLCDRNIFKTTPVEKPAGTVDDQALGFDAVAGGVGHGDFRF